MAPIDCLLIGHNELSIAKNKRMLLYLYGQGSHEYRDRIKYNLSQLVLGDHRYSPSELFNLVRKAEGAPAGQDLSIITESFNLAVAYLASALHRRGLSFEFVNAYQEEKERLRRLLEENEVRSVAIITTYYLSHYPIHDIVTFVRKHNPEAKIVVGGPYVLNRLSGEAVDEPTQKLLELIGADLYVRDSFGEDLLADLVARIRDGADVSDLPNLYHRRDGAFRFSRQEVKAFDFRKTQVEWDLFQGRLSRVMNLRTAVSCPYRCAFCNYPLYAGKYTLSPIEVCERELRNLQGQGVTHVQFVDDTFNVPRERFKELLRMMIRNGFGFRWSSYFKCQYVDRETVRLMKESGCEFVFLGIESGSDEILGNMNKDTSTDVYRRCIELFHEFDIMTMCSVVVGFPGETRDTFEQTRRFIDETRPTFFQQRLWWYDRTAPVHRQKDRFQLTGEGYAWRHATMESKEAHDLADRLFLEVEGAVHITEYALPFFLMERGVTRKNTVAFLRDYMQSNRDQYLHPGAPADPARVGHMLQALSREAP